MQARKWCGARVSGARCICPRAQVKGIQPCEIMTSRASLGASRRISSPSTARASPAQSCCCLAPSAPARSFRGHRYSRRTYHHPSSARGEPTSARWHAAADDPISVGAALPNIAVEVMEDYDAAGAGSPGVTKPIGEILGGGKSILLGMPGAYTPTCNDVHLLHTITPRRASAAWASTRSRSSPQMTASSTRSGRNRWRNAWVSRRARRRL